MKSIRAILFAGLAFIPGATVLAADSGTAPARDQARQILDAAGLQGGLVMHIGCGDGQLTAALRAGDSFVVHGMDADGKNVESARRRIHSLDLYGKVAVEQWSGVRLPYAENMVNLVVSEDLGAIPMSEVMRVLVPEGVAYINTRGNWTKTVKPRPKEIDEWTHFLHAPDNNAVAKDRVVDQPRRLQWLSEPTSTRSHDNLASMSAMVSSGGRLFCIEDEGSISAVALPTKWMLVARDAFNGVLLWKRPIGSWEGHLRGFRSGPTELPRRLVAIGGRVYVTLGYGTPVTALNAATGNTLTTFTGTENALEMICCDGTLLVVMGDRKPDNTDGAAMPSRPGEEPFLGVSPVFTVKPPRKSLLAFDALSAAPMWRKSDNDTAKMMPTTLAAAAGRVFFHSPTDLVAVERKSGKSLWRATRPLTERRPEWSAPTLVVSGDVVLSGDRTASSSASPAAEPQWLVSVKGGESPPGELIAFSATSGQRLWSCPCRESYNSPPDVLVVDGVMWTGELVGSRTPGITLGRDVKTGKVVRERPNDQSQFEIIMGHHRCYRNKATERFLILGRDGIEFIDVATGKGEENFWTRGTCQYGVMPCNGLVYSPPHSCACHIEAKLNGFYSYAPAATAQPSPMIEEERRLEKGPAYGEAGFRVQGSGTTGETGDRNVQCSNVQCSMTNDFPLPTSQSPLPNPSDWPTYRHDAARSGCGGSIVSAAVEALWSTPILTGGRLSSPVAAEGKIFVAGIDAHTVYALDAEKGQVLWQYTAGGRVDSPPTIHQGMVLFGCADGRIYCLRAADGQLAWRYLAAPEDRRVVAFGQLESAWPVSGSVLVQNGVLVAVAGRSTYLDGGMFLCRLDPRTGRRLSETRIMGDALPDVLSCDGSSIFLRHARFDKDGTPQAPNVPHLFSPAGFLDAAWWHRTYWFIGTKMESSWGRWLRAGNNNPAGRLIVQDGNTAYCFGLLGQYNNDKHVGLGATRYQLFACAAGPQTSAAANPMGATIVAKPSAGKKKAKDKQSLDNPPERRPAPRWAEPIPLQARAMILGGKTLFVAGPPDFLGAADTISADDNPYYIRSRQPLAEQETAFAGKSGALLWAVSASDGKKVSECKLESPPVFDGMISANSRLFIATMDGKVVCLGGKDTGR